MDTLKITFLLLAILFLTVSGQSSDVVVDSNEATLEIQKQYDLLAHAKKKARLEPQA